jgi:hypothetical protein
MDFEYFAKDIIYCNEEYYTLSKTFRAQVTFQQFVSIKILRWTKYEVTHWAKKMEEIHYWSSIVEENRAKESKEVDTSLPASKWKEAWIESTPIRSRELQHHRCRGKGKVHYDIEDENETMDAYLEKYDETNDSYASNGQVLASEVTPGLLAGAEPDTHQFNVTIYL